MNKILYIPIETKARELPSKLLLTYFALKRGFSVVIGKQKVVNNLVYAGASGIYLMKSGDSHLEQLNKDDLVVIINDAEGIVFEDETDFVNRSAPISKIDHICTAGSIQKDFYLQNLNNKFRPKIHIIGEPRFDLFSNDFFSKFNRLSRLKVIANKRPYIFLPTSFPLVNPAPYYDKVLLKSKYSEGYISSLELVFNEYIELIDRLSKNFPEFNLIIRPHPSENIKFWKERFKKYSNVHVNQDESAMYWIYYSKVVIFNTSTTGLESILMKRSAINFIPGGDYLSNLVVTKYIGKIAKSISQVINYVELELVEPGIVLDYDNDVKKISGYLSMESKLSVNRLLDVICEEYDDKFKLQQQSINRIPTSLMYKIATTIYKLSWSLDFIIEKYLRIRPLYYFSSRIQQFPNISKNDIMEYFKVFDEIYEENLNEKSVIKKINSDVFFVSMKVK